MKINGEIKGRNGFIAIKDVVTMEKLCAYDPLPPDKGPVSGNYVNFSLSTIQNGSLFYRIGLYTDPFERNESLLRFYFSHSNEFAIKQNSPILGD